MSITRMSRRFSFAAVGSVLGILLCNAPVARAALAYDINVDTTQLQVTGDPWNVVLRIYANTVDGSNPEPFDDTATLTDVQYGGPFKAAALIGNVVEDGRTSLVIHDNENTGDGEFIYTTTLKTDISFHLVLAGQTINGTNSDADGYGFEIDLDDNGAEPFLDSRYFAALEIYTDSNSPTPIVDANAIITVTPTSVPEPTALATAAFMGSLLLRRRKSPGKARPR